MIKAKKKCQKITKKCPTNKINIGNTTIKIPQNNNWCKGYDIKQLGLYSNKKSVKIIPHVTITTKGLQYLIKNKDKIWKYTHIGYDKIDGDKKPIFEKIFKINNLDNVKFKDGKWWDQLQSEYKKIMPSTQKDSYTGKGGPSYCVYTTLTTIAQIWIIMTDGQATYNRKGDKLIPKSRKKLSGYQTCAPALVVAIAETGGNNIGSNFTIPHTLNGPQFANDPGMEINQVSDSGANGGWWQISNMVTSAATGKIRGYPKGKTAPKGLVNSLNRANLYNPFFVAYMVPKWAANCYKFKLFKGVDSCVDHKRQCVAADYKCKDPKCFAGFICEGNTWNSPLVKGMRSSSEVCGYDQHPFNSLPNCSLAQHAAYNAAKSIIKADTQRKFKALNWETNTEFNKACLDFTKNKDPKIVCKPKSNEQLLYQNKSKYVATDTNVKGCPKSSSLSQINPKKSKKNKYIIFLLLLIYIRNLF